jgi:Glycosyl hydrolases family 2, TIM barrel domain/Glycosyl hydrolases family 2, sugar binding domain/Glycosyl hydrolases family 2
MNTLLLLTLLPLLAPAASEAEWRPAKGPLTTRWTSDVVPGKVHPEYPRPTMVRSAWRNLNGLWQFAEAREGEQPPTGQTLPKKILVPFPIESALSGVMKPIDRAWYRRTFQVDPAWAKERVLLHFGAVNWEAKVFLNGKKLGSHHGGYDGFSFDLTNSLKPEGEQELIVGVWNPADTGTQPRGKQVKKPGGIYYTPSTGIWQTVWIEPVPKFSIRGMKIIPNADTGTVQITLQTRGSGDGLTVQLEARKAKQEVARAEGKPGTPIELTVPRDDLKLWSPESPFLYDLHVTLLRDMMPVDHVESYFALRKIEIGKDGKGITRMLLNGKPTFQMGLLDQGFWPDGLYTAPTDAALRYDIEITKQLGFNLARKHVKVEPERWYYWCDKLGLLVWQDMPSGDKGVAPGQGEIQRTQESAAQYERELQRMLESRSNHPCIILWVPFNEGWGQYDTARITAWIKKHDPTRLVDCASGWNDMKVGDVHDIHVYPGPGSPRPEPTRAAVLGEFGGLGLGIDGHTWTNKTWGYQGVRDKDDLTRRYEKLLKRVHELKEKPGLCAAIYTQTTDVETEANGLLTYDRAVLKVSPERVAAANRGDFSGVPEVRVVVPTSKDEGLRWRYTIARPAGAWYKADFDDAAWMEGLAGFGTKETPGAVVRTEWKSDDIWIRRIFTLPDGKLHNPHLLLHHDDDVEVYLNGVLAAKLTRWTTDYEETGISAEARAALKPGQNVFAVHCHQVKGGQYIDVGLVDVVPVKPKTPR